MRKVRKTAPLSFVAQDGENEPPNILKKLWDGDWKKITDGEGKAYWQPDTDSPPRRPPPQAAVKT